MSAQHTPGPWALASSGANCFTVHADDSASIVAYTMPRFKVSKGHAEPTSPSEEDWANARLIAAAPELLEALEAIVAESDKLPEHQFQLAVAAIAKAKGGAA